MTVLPSGQRDTERTPNPKRPPPMNSQAPHSIASSRSSAITPDPTLSHALSHGLRQPLDSLSYSIQSMARECDPADPRGQALDEALGEVARLGRNVRDLIDYAYPPEPHALSCSVDEILYSTRFQVPRALWSRTWIARDLPSGAPMPRLDIDGPVLAHSLARMVHAAGPELQRLLLRASCQQGEVHFTLTFRGTSTLEADPMGLCHAIAERDLSVIGCCVEEHTTPLGHTTIQVRVPFAAVVPELAA